MNYTSHIVFSSLPKWMAFGRAFSKVDDWKEIVGYLKTLDDKKQMELGLLDFTMNLPRPDNECGFIRARITAIDLKRRALSISFNNHIQIPDNSAINMIKLLNDHWSKSLQIAKDTRDKIMQFGLRN